MLKYTEEKYKREDLRFGLLLSFIKKALGSKQWTEPLAWFGHKPEEKRQQTNNDLRNFFKRRQEIRAAKSGAANG